jgi:hypothetical protein
MPNLLHSAGLFTQEKSFNGKRLSGVTQQKLPTRDADLYNSGKYVLSEEHETTIPEDLELAIKCRLSSALPLIHM